MLYAKNAFTLVELSIVLVILGLLVGGVLAGQSLIRAAELKAVGTEHHGFVTAYHTFRDKYFAAPGDMPNATRYWGAMAGTTADGFQGPCTVFSSSGTATSTATGTLTCNGNGNEIIGRSPSDAADYEQVHAWQHLANAGLIAGSYSGRYAFSARGSNVPKSRLGNASWTLNAINQQHNDHYYFAANYRNVLALGSDVFGFVEAQGAILKPEDAHNIDMKLDDGKPHTGKILTYKNSFASNTCVNAGKDAYLLSDTTVQCNLFFIGL